MASDLVLYGSIAAAATTSLAIGFSLPALTTGGSGGSREVEMQVLVSEERRYCRVMLEGVNCTCFANRSGYLLDQERPHAQGYWYPDHQDLARRQAVTRCRK